MRRLVALPFHKSLQMAYQSIKIRFFRSLITTMSLVLAVAFLCYIQAGNDLAQSLLTNGDQNIHQQLAKAGYDVMPGDTNISASAKQRWIVFLSLLVCVVGIINAQVMSVTERFREIGTLKCLGALDRYIVRLFVLEAAMQGLTGSLCGAVIGTICATGSALIRFGWDVLYFFPFQEITLTILASSGIGAFLSLIGVLYPALLAARMQPAEAMRAE